LFQIESGAEIEFVEPKLTFTVQSPDEALTVDKEKYNKKLIRNKIYFFINKIKIIKIKLKL
jgi:hypothetical protein